MANQAIALQARAPQTDILGGAIRNNAQLINTMSQQRAAERQNAMAQQQMQLAQEKSTRDAASFDIDMAGKKIDFYTKRAGQTMNAQGYQLLLQDLDRDAPEIAAAFRTNMPPEQFDRGVLLQMVGSVSDNFKANYGPLETEVVQMEDGTFGVAVTGGVGKTKPGVYELQYNTLRRGGGVPAAAAAPTAAAPQQGGVMAQPSQGANTTPQDLMRQGVNPNSIPSGNPLSPISTGGGAQPDLGTIVQQMMQTGVISQADMGLMTQAAGPEKAQQLAQIMRANNIQIMPDEQAPSAGMRNAVFRPDEGAPAFQQAQSMEDYVGTGRAARGKSPMQSPVPGTALLDPNILGAQKGAEAQATKGVELQTAPKIAAATKTAENRVAKDAAFPDAQAQFDAALSMIDNRLADIERFRKHPAASRVIGPLDAFTPNFGRARGAQAIYDALVGTATLDALQDMREKSVTGGALGNVSDADIRLLRQSIGALGQDQDETDFNDSLRIHENRLRQTRDRLVQRYRENYSYKLGSKWQPQAPAARGGGGGRKVGGFSVMRVED